MPTKHRPTQGRIVTETGDVRQRYSRRAARFTDSETASWDFRAAALFVAGWVVIGILCAAFWVAVAAILWIAS